MNVQPLPAEKYEPVHEVVQNLHQPAYDRLVEYATNHGLAAEDVVATALGLLYGLTEDGTPVDFDDLPRDAIYKPHEPFGGPFVMPAPSDDVERAEAAAEGIRRAVEEQTRKEYAEREAALREKLEQDRTDVRAPRQDGIDPMLCHDGKPCATGCQPGSMFCERDRQFMHARDADMKAAAVSEPVVIEGGARRTDTGDWEHADFGLIPPGLATRLENLEGLVRSIDKASDDDAERAERQAEHLADLERRLKLQAQEAAAWKASANELFQRQTAGLASIRAALLGAVDAINDEIES
jgi:hypothetical protein